MTDPNLESPVRYNREFVLLCIEMAIRSAGLMKDIRDNMFYDQKIDGKNRIVQLKEVKEKFADLEAYLRIIEENYDRIKINDSAVNPDELFNALNAFLGGAAELQAIKNLVTYQNA